MIKRIILFSSFAIIMVSGIVHVRSIDNIQASTNPLSSAYNVIKEGSALGDFSPSEGEVIGIISIPRLNSEMPIIEGIDQSIRGISHELNSSFPGDNGLIVLNVLEGSIEKRLEELQIGDEIVINLPYGSFIYQVKESLPLTSYNDYQSENECLILTTSDKSYTIFADRVKATN